MATDGLSGLMRMLPGQPVQASPFDISKKQMGYLKKQLELTDRALQENRLIHVQWNRDQEDYEFTVIDRPTTLIQRIFRAVTRIWSDAAIQHTIWKQARNIEAILNNDKIPLKERDAFRKAVAAPLEDLIELSNKKFNGFYSLFAFKFETYEINNLYNAFKRLPDELIFKDNRTPLDIYLHGNDYTNVEHPFYQSYAQSIVTLRRDQLEDALPSGTRLSSSDRVEFTLYRTCDLENPVLTKTAVIKDQDTCMLFQNMPGNNDLTARVAIKRNSRTLAEHDIPCRANYRYNQIELSHNPSECKFEKLPIPISRYAELTGDQQGMLSPVSNRAQLRYSPQTKKLPVTLSAPSRARIAVELDNTSKDFCTISTQVELPEEAGIEKPNRAVVSHSQVVHPKSLGQINASDITRAFYKTERPSSPQEKALRYQNIHLNIFSSRLRSE